MMDEKITKSILEKEQKEKDYENFIKEKEKLIKGIEKSDWIICAYQTEDGFGCVHLRFMEQAEGNDMKTAFEAVGFMEYIKETILDGTIREKIRQMEMIRRVEGFEKMLFESLPDEIKKKIKDDSN